MTDALRIARMSRADLDVAIGWAAEEGWNPGLDDADTFHKIDPEGFLMGWLGAEPVAAISVARHSEGFGFLGFYLCRPVFRGQGHGFAMWQAGMAHLGDRTVGLDGVVAQQDNYQRSGFELSHNTRRHEGIVEGRAHSGFRPARPEDQTGLRALDSEVQGVTRTTYADRWFEQSATRQTLVMEHAGTLVAVGTIRTCRRGHKIGPLISADQATARALVESLVATSRAHQIAIDIPDPNILGLALASEMGLTSSFSCARMYRGAPPSRDLTRLFAETSFELG